MYQVLYRKWRPRTFEDVVGQTHITKTLKNEIKLGHIAHAYLFIGQRGTGKTSCAKIFSLAVNCLSPKDGSPCGECLICKEAMQGGLIDISEIDAASNNGVENVRTIKEEAFLVPNVCKYRVYIIDEAHMLSMQAFNAFLKILEEPPRHVIFILATTEPHKIPVTILSRCQRFEFHRIENSDIKKRLMYICKEENIESDEEALDIISSGADGAMRDALSLLDRCVSCHDGVLDGEKVREILGIADAGAIESIFENIKKRETKAALDLIDMLYDKSCNMLGLCDKLLELFRKDMINIVSCNNSKDDLNFCVNCLDCLCDAHRRMHEGLSGRTELEIAVTKMCTGIFYEKKEEKEEVFSNNEAEKTQKIQKSKKTERNLGVDEKDIKGSDDEKFKDWGKVLEVIKENSKSKTFCLALKDSKAYLKGDFILIDAKKDLLFELLRENQNKEEVKNAIKAVTGIRYKLGPYRSVKEKEVKEGKEETTGMDRFLKRAKDLGVKVNFE